MTTARCLWEEETGLGDVTEVAVGELLGMLKAQDDLLRNTEWKHNQGAWA